MSCKSLSIGSLLPRLRSRSGSLLGTMDGYPVARTHLAPTLSSLFVSYPVLEPRRCLAHHSHSHSHHKPTNSTTPQGAALSNALSASLLPVGTATPGAPVAHVLSTPGTAPSTVPSGASGASNNKVIVVFKAGTPASDFEAAVKDCESKGKLTSWPLLFLCEAGRVSSDLKRTKENNTPC